MKIILASKSQRRQELLQQFGYNFTVHTEEVFEAKSGRPLEIALANALAKAEAVTELFPKDLVIGSDTIVVYENLILGKPSDPSDAWEMLKTLSGKQHHVITGVALCMSNRKPITFFEETTVRFRDIEDYEIQGYVDTNEPLDKAGSYGIQGIGGAFVESISGCYYNVVGLPMPRLILELRTYGFDIFTQGGD